MEDVTVSVAENGRLVLPVSLRRRLNIAKGGTIVIREEDGRLLLESLDVAIGRAQALVRRFAPVGHFASTVGGDRGSRGAQWRC